MTKLGQDVTKSLNNYLGSIGTPLSSQMKDASSESVTKKRSILQENVHKLLHTMRLNLDEEVSEQETESRHTLSQGSIKFSHNRVFVVVMDYDPQSLCITGQPELELLVHSGRVSPCLA